MKKPIFEGKEFTYMYSKKEDFCPKLPNSDEEKKNVKSIFLILHI